MGRAALHVAFSGLVPKRVIQVSLPWAHGTINQILLEKVETDLIVRQAEVVENDIRFIVDLNSREIIVQLQEGYFIRGAVTKDLVVFDVNVREVKIQKKPAQIDVKDDVVEEINFVGRHNAVENIVRKKVEFIEVNLDVIWAENERLIGQ